MPQDVRALIRDMSTANPLWGAPRIHGELLKLGISVSESTVAKYMRRDAFPENESPRYLIHDRDSVFAHVATTLDGMDIQEVRTAPRSPWQNAYVERVIGSIRRECLDHVIAVNGAGLRRVLTAYVTYYMRSRTHLGFGKDTPSSRPVTRPQPGALSPFQKSAACTTATTASRRNRNQRVPPTQDSRRTPPLHVEVRSCNERESPGSAFPVNCDSLGEARRASQVFEVIDLRLHRLLGSYTLQASREPTTAAPRSRTACRWA